MDGTPYPPPAPSVPPAGAPQPQYAPQAPYAPAPPPPKKKTGLIIGIVVAVILLCCCGSSVAGLLLFRSADTEGTKSLEEVTSDLPDLNSDVAEDEVTLDTGWEDFAPATYDPSVWVAPDAFHASVVDDAMASLFPDFELTDVLVRPSTEYSTDTVLVRAELTSDSDAVIAYWLEVENIPAYESGWVWDPERDGYDYMDVATASNGHEYSWDNTQLVPLHFGISDATTEDLLRTVAADFPDCVIYLVENDGETAYVEFTRWEAYPDYDSGYYADYSYDGSGWTLEEAALW